MIRVLLVCVCVLCVVCVCLFFFQAEDGIRDLVRSRGLGDVYKRQAEALERELPELLDTLAEDGQLSQLLHGGLRPHRLAPRLEPVSYTHLTLPTSDLV